MAIESWSASVPGKRTQGISEDIDPVVQAYLETKMALFRSVASSDPHEITAMSKKQ